MFCVMCQGAGESSGTLGGLVLQEGLLNGPLGTSLLVTKYFSAFHTQTAINDVSFKKYNLLYQ